MKPIEEYTMKLPEQIWTHEQIIAAEKILRQIAEDVREECAKKVEGIQIYDLETVRDYQTVSNVIRLIEIK